MPQSLHLGLVAQNEAAVFEGLPDGPQQHFVTEWFREEFNSPCLYGLDRRGYVAVPRDEDDRHVGPFDRYAILQVEAVQAWKRNVQDETARNKRSWAVKEFLCGRVCLWLPAFAANQQFQRL